MISPDRRGSAADGGDAGTDQDSTSDAGSDADSEIVIDKPLSIVETDQGTASVQ
jgi:hypothetical protein